MKENLLNFLQQQIQVARENEKQSNQYHTNAADYWRGRIDAYKEIIKKLKEINM